MDNKNNYIGLIAYAMHCNYDEAEKKLNAILESGKKPVAVYPGLGDKETGDMEYIGSIIDGGLYISKA